MFHKFGLALVILMVMAATARTENQQVTLHLSDGQTLTGELAQINEAGLLIRQTGGQLAPRVPWTKLSQADLKELQDNPKARQFVEPFIEVSQEEIIKKTEVDIKPFPKFERPASPSFLL